LEEVHRNSECWIISFGAGLLTAPFLVTVASLARN
jgi:hypothetical protein